MSGTAVYVDDIPKIEGELYLALVTSKKAHAKIVNVDVQPSVNQEPSVTITSTTEDGSIVRATVKVPKDDQDLLPVAIGKPKNLYI